MKLPAPTREDLRQLARVQRGEAVSKPGAFLAAVRAEVVARTTPENVSLARDFLSRSGGERVVTVQAASAPDASTARTITDRVSDGADTLVRVRIERNLLGGLRVFRNGALHDASWRSRISGILSALRHS